MAEATAEPPAAPDPGRRRGRFLPRGGAERGLDRRPAGPGRPVVRVRLVHFRLFLPAVAELAWPLVPAPASAHPHLWSGTLIMGLIVISAAIADPRAAADQGGHKGGWQRGPAVALVLGLARRRALQIWQLHNLPFWPGCVRVRQRLLRFLARLPVRRVRRDGLAGDPDRCGPGDTRDLVRGAAADLRVAFAVQRFQASLSAFTLTWNYMAAVAVVAWVLFYLIHLITADLRSGGLECRHRSSRQ